MPGSSDGLSIEIYAVQRGRDAVLDARARNGVPRRLRNNYRVPRGADQVP